jgi:hypothetical protein
MRSSSSLFPQFATEQTPPRRRHSMAHAVIVTVPPLDHIMSTGTNVVILMLTDRL